MSAPTRRASSRQIRRSASRTSRVELTVAEIAASASLSASRSAELGVQPRVVLRQAPPVEHARDDRAEPREIDGLHDVARAPALHRLDRRIERRVPRHHDDLGRRVDAPGLAHEARAVDVGEIEVEQDEREARLADEAEPVGRRWRRRRPRIPSRSRKSLRRRAASGSWSMTRMASCSPIPLSLSPPGSEHTVLEEHEHQPRQLHADENDQPAITPRPADACDTRRWRRGADRGERGRVCTW